MKKIICLIMSLLLWGCDKPTVELDMSSFAGLWEVDFDRTMEAVRQSPKYTEDMAEDMPEIVKRMMSKMKIQLTDTAMVSLFGSNSMAIPFTVTSATADHVTATVQEGGQVATLDFFLIDQKYMTFKSSVSDDMHFYIWKKVDPTVKSISETDAP